jgi:hypothetical protein
MPDVQTQQQQKITIRLPDGSERTHPTGATGYDVAEAMTETDNARVPVIIHSMNIREARCIPPLLPRCRMCSFAELRKRCASGQLEATIGAFAGGE